MTDNSPFVLTVDFGNSDEDGAVRLVTNGAIESIKAYRGRVFEGAEVLLTDGELNARGVLAMRDGMWIAIVSKWLGTL